MEYQKGNTVRLEAQFYDWEDQPVDPTLVKLIIYDYNHIKLDEISIPPSNRLDVGSYYYDYVFSQAGVFVYEWYAEIDGKPSLRRNRFSVAQV